MLVEKETIKWNGELTLKWHEPSCILMQKSNDGESETNVYSHYSKKGCNCHGKKQKTKNLVMLNGLYSIIDKLIDINNTDTNNGFINYMEIGLSSTAPVNSQTALVLSQYRKFMNSAVRSGTNAVYGAFFSGVQGNTASSLVATGISTTQFTVTTGEGILFTAGETIKVGSQTKIIQSVVGDTITLTTALTTTPTAGTTVQQCIAELGLFGGSAATSTAGTGIMFARTTNFTPEPKPNGYGATIEWAVTLT